MEAYHVEPMSTALWRSFSDFSLGLAAWGTSFPWKKQVPRAPLAPEEAAARAPYVGKPTETKR